MGWWRSPILHLLPSPSTSANTGPRVVFRTFPPWWRHLDTSLILTHLHCHWIATEQDLSPQEGNMEEFAESLPTLAPEKCHSVHTHSRLGRTLDVFMDTTFPAASQSHFSPRHHSIHPTLSRGRLSQWRQARHFPAHLLPVPLLWMSEEHLFRPSGLQTIGRVPWILDPVDAHQATKTIQEIISLVAGQGSCSSQRLCATKTQEAVSLWPSSRQLLRRSIPTHAELHRQAHLPAPSSGFSTQPGQRWCLWTYSTSEARWLWLPTYTSYLQPRPRWLLHEHWHWSLCYQLASHFTLPQPHHEHTTRWTVLGQTLCGQPTRRCGQRTNLSHFECDAQDLHPRHWIYHSCLFGHDPVLHRHCRFPADPGFTHGLSVKPCPLPHGCGSLRRGLVPHFWVPALHHGPHLSMSPLRGQPFVPPRLFLVDRTSSWLVLAPRFLWQTHCLGDWARPRVPGLHLGVWPFHATIFTTSWPESSDGSVFSVSFERPALRLRLSPVFGGKMCPPLIRTVPRFCRIASFVQTCWFSWRRSDYSCPTFFQIHAYPPFVVKNYSLLSRCPTMLHSIMTLPISFHTLATTLSTYPFCVRFFFSLTLFSPLALSVCSFWLSIGSVHISFAMGSDFTTPVERPLSPRLNDGTFPAFLHDTHHAYLLLHRAFQSIPPTVIPDMVPTPHPGPEELDQPDYLRPTSSPVPFPTDEDEENEIFKLATSQDLPHRMATAKVPPPVRHFAAPDAVDVPIPNSTLSKSPLRSPPKAPSRHRRRSTGSHLDRAAEARNISRSRSSSVRAAPRAWTQEDIAKLRELKKDSRARPAWKTIAGKLARNVDDCKMRWKRIQKMLVNSLRFFAHFSTS